MSSVQNLVGGSHPGPITRPSTAQISLQDWNILFDETTDTWNIDDLMEAINGLYTSKLSPPSTSSPNASGRTKLGRLMGAPFLKFVKKHKVQLCSKSKSNPASTSSPNSPSGRTELGRLIDRGAKFLKFVNEHTGQLYSKDSHVGSGHREVLAEVLHILGQIHWIGGGLSSIAYLLNKVENVSKNRSECLRLLKRMFDLASHIIKMRGLMPEKEHKFREAFSLVVEGCMYVASQLRSGKLFRFLKSSVTSEALRNLESQIHNLHEDLNLTVTIELEKGQPSYRPVIFPTYPKEAVGLQIPLDKLKEKLDLQASEARVVVIHGIGGIGKTTLADALVATLVDAKDLEDYNYTKVAINEQSPSNDFKSIQQHILLDCFPAYESGKTIALRNCEEGRYHITKALNRRYKKPLFIYFDNVLSDELQKLIPEDLGSLPDRSRILVTARNLAVTEFFKEPKITLHVYAVNALSEEHALQILCNDFSRHDGIRKSGQKILEIAGGIPLVLKIYGAHLVKQNYNVSNCSDILRALEKGEDVKEDRVSERLFRFVYDQLEKAAQEAFLDICFFLNGWYRPLVECIVGVRVVKQLLDAALVTSIPVVNSITDIWQQQGIDWAGEEKLMVLGIIQAQGLKIAQQTRIKVKGLKGLKSWSGASQNQVQAIQGVDFEDYEHTTVQDPFRCISKPLRILNLRDCKDCAHGRHTSEELSCLQLDATDTFDELRCLQLDAKFPRLPINLEELPLLSYYVGPISREILSELPGNSNLKYLKNLECHSDMDETQVVENSSLEVLDLSVQDMPVKWRFDALKILWLKEWDQKDFPLKVCGLRSLEKLILRSGGHLNRVPDEIANLRALTHLDLSGCCSLEEVSSSLGQLTALRYLDLSECAALRRLPETFGQLSKLEYLSLCDCEILEELPQNFGLLRSLKGLNLSRCYGLKELPSNFVLRLEVLYVLGVCKLVAALGQIGNCKIISF